MLTADTITKDKLDVVKRHLSITWSDDDTDQKLVDMILDNETELNHVLGAECDYFAPGPERRLFLNRMMYVYNDCLNEFDSAYRADIIRIRHLKAVTADD